MIFVALKAAVIGCAWILIMVAPYGIFDFLPDKCHGLPDKLKHAWFGCEMCLSGQVALILYPIYFFQTYTQKLEVSIVEHIVCVCLASIVAGFIGKLWNKM